MNKGAPSGIEGLVKKVRERKEQGNWVALKGIQNPVKKEGEENE